MNFGSFRSASTAMRRLIVVTMITCILLVLCPTVIACAQWIAGSPEGTPGGNGDNQGTDKITYTSIPVASSDVYSKGTLLIVNNDTPIRTYPSDTQLVRINGENKASSYKVKTDQFRLRSEALIAFNEMLNAYFAATNDGTVIITSAYRTEAEQAALTSSTVKAGYSDHHLALSLALKQNDERSTSELPNGHWIYENGYKYGYIQRYPQGKESSTGDTQAYYNCVRYVGIPHATYMKENNLSLEEYVEAVKSYTQSGTHLSVSAGGATYEIYYVPANLMGSDTDVTTLTVPSNREYSYSGNNTDGFIVTVKIS